MTSSSPDPAAALLAIADHLHRRELPPDAVCDYLVGAVRAWLNGSPVDVAFRLRPSGASFARRNAAQVDAGRLVGGDPHRLAREVRQFEARVGVGVQNVQKVPLSIVRYINHLDFQTLRNYEKFRELHPIVTIYTMSVS